MTTDDPGSTNYLLGRIEGKLDRLDEKVDHQGEVMAGYGERIGAVERDVRDIKAQRLADQAARAAEQQQSQQQATEGRRWSVGTWIAVASVLVAIAAVVVSAIALSIGK
jgi:Flp pilus assembly protein TadB